MCHVPARGGARAFRHSVFPRWKFRRGAARPGEPVSSPTPISPAIPAAATIPDSAAIAPAAPPDGLPDPSMTTIPSYVPTPPPQSQVLQTSSGRSGGPEFPQPGASLEPDVPSGFDQTRVIESDYVADCRGRTPQASPHHNRAMRRRANPTRALSIPRGTLVSPVRPRPLAMLSQVAATVRSHAPHSRSMGCPLAPIRPLCCPRARRLCMPTRCILSARHWQLSRAHNRCRRCRSI